MKTADTHHSNIIDQLLNEADPRELKRVENRVMLAAKIEDTLKARNLKKTEFARMMGCKPSQVTKWLSGTNNFTADVLSDIQDVLGIELLNVRREEECVTETRVFIAEIKATMHLTTNPLGLPSKEETSSTYWPIPSKPISGWGGITVNA